MRQIELFERPQWRHEWEIRLDLLTPNEDIVGPSPEKKFVDSIRTFGVIIPIVVQIHRPYWKIMAGGRRIKASRQLGMSLIQGFVIGEGEECPSLVIPENELRKPNNALRTMAVSELLLKGYTEEEAAQRLGVPLHRVRRDASMLRMNPKAVAAYCAGMISDSAMAKLAGRTPREQERAVALLDDGVKLTHKAIAEIRQDVTEEYRAMSPSMFTLPGMEGVSMIQNAKAHTDRVVVSVISNGQVKEVTLSVEQVLSMGGV